MFTRRLLISVLGLAALAVPLSATTTFYTGNNAQTDFNNATTGLFFPDPLTGFDPGNLSASGLEYDDPGTSTSFFGYSNPTNPAQLTVVNNNLRPTIPGGLIEILLPSAVYAFGATITVPSGSGTFCIELHDTFNTGSNCDETFSVLFGGDNEFIGVVSSIPITAIWLGPAGLSPTLSMENFEVGEDAPPTPELATMVLIGSGLIFLPWLRRWQRARRGTSAQLRAAPCE